MSGADVGDGWIWAGAAQRVSSMAQLTTQWTAPESTCWAAALPCAAIRCPSPTACARCCPCAQALSPRPPPPDLAGKEATYQAAVAAAQAGQPFAIVLGTGGTEAAALELARHYHREYRKAQQALAGELPHEPLWPVAGSSLPPLVFVAHPYSNSLPSALEALARLQQDGLLGRAVYLASAAAGNPQGEEGWATLKASLDVSGAWDWKEGGRGK